MTRKRQHLPSPRRAAAAPVLAKIVHPDQLCRMPHRRCHAAMPLNGEKTPLPARNALRRVTPCYAVAPLRQRARSTDIVFARSEPRQQPFVYGNPSRPAGACGAHVRGIRDRRPRDPCPAGRACDVRVPARRTVVGGGPAASAGSRAGRHSPWRGPQAIPPVGEPRRDRVRSFAGRRRVPRDHSPGGSGTSSLRASFFSILVPNTLLLFFFARRLLHRWASLGGIASDPLRAGGASREITARGGAVRRPFVLVSFPF